MEIALLVVGFVLLVGGASFLVDGSCSLARRLGVSDLAIGLTLVAFGTSAPELAVNLIASYRGNTEIAIGNILGSNIFNILLILGFSCLLYPLAVTRGTVWKEIPFSLLAAILVGITANDVWMENCTAYVVGRTDGIGYLLVFVIFLYYVYGMMKNGESSPDAIPSKIRSIFKSLLFVSAGLAALVVGAKWVVDGAIVIAQMLGVSESVIGLTIVAGGTSLPELATSIVAAYRKNADIAVGNVVGSNIFNIFLILGTSAVIRPLPFQASSNIDIGMTVLASLLLFLFMFTGRKRTLDRWEGALFLLIYGVYLVYLIQTARQAAS